MLVSLEADQSSEMKTLALPYLDYGIREIIAITLSIVVVYAFLIAVDNNTPMSVAFISWIFISIYYWNVSKEYEAVMEYNDELLETETYSI